MNKPILMLFKLTFAGLFLFMMVFIMKLEISDYDSFSYLAMANYNAGFPYFEEPEFNTRPPLYPFILTPITALQHLGVSPKDLLTLAHFFALIFSFAFIASSYLILKLLLIHELAALGALLLMIQPGFLVYSFEPMVDLPCSLLLVLAMQFYFRYRKSPNLKNLLWICLWIGLGMAMKYSLVVVPLILSLAEILVLKDRKKMRWSNVFQSRFIYLVPLLSTGIYFLACLISFAPKYGWTWKNLTMAYSPFFRRIEYSGRADFQFDFMANFSFLEIQMTLPWFILMILGLYLCLKHKEWKSMVVWSWFVGCLAFITFVNWDYQVRYLFPVMPACYYFSLYAVQNIYNWVQIILAGKSYFPALRAVVFFALLVLPVMSLAGEIKSLRGDLYQKETSSKIVRRVKELFTEKDRVWWLGNYYALYRLGEQIHPQDWYYKIDYLGNNALSFLSAKKIWTLPEHTSYEISPNITNGNILIYYPSPLVSSKFLPPPEILPPILVGRVYPLVYMFEKKSGNVKKFLTQDGTSSIHLTSVEGCHIVIEMSRNGNRVSGKILWFKLDSRIIEPRRVQKNFFYFRAKEDMVLPLGGNYFEQIQEITLLRYQAKEFR